jgi:hypothetical protein
MKSIFDKEVQEEILRRAKTLKPYSVRLWGKMSVEQMLWHLSAQLRIGLGDIAMKPWFNKIISRIAVWTFGIRIPWSNNLMTAKEMKNDNPASFQVEQDNFLITFDRFLAKAEHFKYSPHPIFGEMSREEWGKIAYKHIDHHFRQFGV